MPNSQGCLSPNVQSLPFCDTSLPIPARVADLVSRLSLQQKAAWLTNGQVPIPSLNISSYEFGAEALHGLQGNCITQGNVTRCPSFFPAGPSLGTTFNKTLLHRIGEAIGDEVRATVNLNVPRAYGGEYMQPSVWMPNLNINRDPRWGRAQETFSEDPFVIGTLGALMIDGTAHGTDGFDAPYLKTIVISKHATGYQVENDRFGFNPNFSPHDIAATYLPAWEIAASCSTPGQGCFSGYMCAYDSVYGLPMCASDWFRPLMESYGLGQHKYNGSYIQADCAAVKHIQRGVLKNFTMTQAVAWILNNNAVDKECGGILFMPNGALAAISQNLTTVETVDASISRTLTLQFLTGRFDPVEKQTYTNIGFEPMDSPTSQALAWEAAAQGATLLRNDKGALPFTPGSSVACIGPFCNVTSDLLGNYWSIRCEGASQGTNPCIPTFLQGLQGANPDGGISYTYACDVNNEKIVNISAAVAAAQAADVVVLSMGTNQATCQEGVDRTDMSVPGAFLQVAEAVLAVGKPTVVVFTSGGALGFDSLATYGGPTPLALVWAPYPGEMGYIPLAAQLFGKVNHWGKLPITLYPSNYTSMISMTDMAMPPNSTQRCCDFTCQSQCRNSVGRTYKYYTGPVLYPFGWGLSYTNFSLSGTCNVTEGGVSPLSPLSSIGCSVTIKNTGNREGDEVVIVYVGPYAESRASFSSLAQEDPLAVKMVVDFARVSLDVGEESTIPFTLPFKAFAQADGEGRLKVHSGRHRILFSSGGGQVEVGPLYLPSPVTLREPPAIPQHKVA